MTRIPDELLDYYAEIFIRQRIREQGLTFERFLYLQEARRTERVPAGHARRFAAVWVLGVATLLHACAGDADSETTASRFIDRYYVRADLAQAKALAEGLAARKIEREQALLQGVAAGAASRQRDVSYRLLERRDEGDRVVLVYDLDIKGTGVPTLRKRSLLSLAKIHGAWRILNFHDFDF
jgi:hypothetical protein